MIVLHFLCASCKENSECGETATQAQTLQIRGASYFKKCHMPLGAYSSYIPSVSRVQKLHLFVIITTTLGISAVWVSNNRHIMERYTTARFVHLTAVCSWLLLQLSLKCHLSFSSLCSYSWKLAVWQREECTIKVTSFSHNYIKGVHKK